MTETSHPAVDPSALHPVAVVGAGAVGCYYGGMLARAGVPVTLIARAAHVDAINDAGLRLQAQSFDEQVQVGADTELAAAANARLVLFCVKTRDTESTAQALAPILAPDAIVLDLQNGVDNVRRIQTYLPNPVLATVVYVAASMAGPGHLRHAGGGSLVIGESRQPDARPAALAPGVSTAIAELMEAAGIGCRLSDNIDGELWSKFLINCSFNAVSALGRSRYGRMAASPAMMAVMNRAALEVVAVARALGITMPETDPLKIVARAGQSMAQATSSTEQDIGMGRPTEIDDLNGYLVTKGGELGVDTPVNQTLHALVKLREAVRLEENR
ncbi:MAG: 2-dehydropantoate 2-reductase [Burkholderiaceae bacterium]